MVQISESPSKSKFLLFQSVIFLAFYCSDSHNFISQNSVWKIKTMPGILIKQVLIKKI